MHTIFMVFGLTRPGIEPESTPYGKLILYNGVLNSTNELRVEDLNQT